MPLPDLRQRKKLTDGQNARHINLNCLKIICTWFIPRNIFNRFLHIQDPFDHTRNEICEMCRVVEKIGLNVLNVWKQEFCQELILPIDLTL